MKGAGAPQQTVGRCQMAQDHAVHRGSRKVPRLPFQGLNRFEFDAAAATRVRAIEQGAANWTVVHDDSGLKVEQQVGQLLSRVL
jgi:hypothetical protein